MNAKLNCFVDIAIPGKLSSNSVELFVYFQSKNVIIKHGPFDDEETSSKTFIIEDINGFLLQVLEERK